MANLLDQIGQRNVVRVVSQGVPATLSGLSDTDFSGIGTGMVPVWDGDAFTPIVGGANKSVSNIILTTNPVTHATAWTDTIDGGFF